MLCVFQGPVLRLQVPVSMRICDHDMRSDDDDLPSSSARRPLGPARHHLRGPGREILCQNYARKIEI